MAEAAKDGATGVYWNFSYPTAFSAAQETTFNNTCEEAASYAEEDTGFDVGKTEHWLESQAGAYYFANLDGAQLGDGAICLDIGAGTTDISVISGMSPRIVYHTSLQFAGRYLFRAIYKSYNDFAQKELPQLKDTNDEARRDALIDADMRLHSNEYLKNLKTKIGTGNVDRALQISQFAAAGIFYWLGMLLRDLKKRNIYEEDNVPTIYIGGNGARVFHWICGGKFDAKSKKHLSALGKMLVDESGLTGKCEFVLSDTPKIEVACGMVEDTPPDKDDFFDKDTIAMEMFGKDGADQLIANSVFAGDAFFLGKKSEDNLHHKTEYISARDIKKGVSLANPEAMELCLFADKFKACHPVWNERNPLTMSDGQLSNVAKQVRGIFISQMKKSALDIFVEPIFILELKKFMEML